MGLDIEYQALPAACPLLEQAGRDPELGELLALLPGVLPQRAAGQTWRGTPLSPAEHLFQDEMDRLLAARPSVLPLRLWLGRDWDALHYLLSDERRAGRHDGSDPGTTAVRGAQRLGPHALAGQGLALRWTTPAEVDAVASWLYHVRPAQLALHYDPQALEAAGVYKVSADGQPVEMPDALTDAFERLRAFYADVAAARYGVLVVLD
jgi:hypothetical protein